MRLLTCFSIARTGCIVIAKSNFTPRIRSLRMLSYLVPESRLNPSSPEPRS